VAVGSGLAWTSGFPMSIEGSAPAIFQARAMQTLYNRPLSYQVAAARENAAAVGLDADGKREEVVYRTASMYLDAERLNKQLELAERQVESLERVSEVVRARVAEGRELDIEEKRAALSVAQARQRLLAWTSERDTVEANLALALGYAPDDRVRPAAEERRAPQFESNEADAVPQAESSSKELRRIEAAVRAKGLEVRAAKSAWMPQIDLVAQYGLFSKFNNYEEYFATFARNNAQVGASITFPILPGSASKAEASRAQLEISRLQTQLAATRGRIAVDTRRSLQELRTAESAHEVARLDLEVARGQLGVLLERMNEGRAALREVEDARAVEMARWIAFYEAAAAVERARLDVARRTGSLVAAFER
jgi:outer membrane protein TolC